MVVMRAIDIKEELRVLIDQERDFHILEAIRTLLAKSSLNSTLKAKLTTRALKSEQDIKEGRVLSREEMERKLDNRLGI